MQVNKQKVLVPSKFVKGIEYIINQYPDYCAFEDIPNFEEEDDFAKFLSELANLQILVV